VTLSLPLESERLTVVLGRPGDDAASAWRCGARCRTTRTGRRRRSNQRDAGARFSPARCAQLVDRPRRRARISRRARRGPHRRRRRSASTRRSVSSTSTSTRCVMRVVRLGAVNSPRCPVVSPVPHRSGVRHAAERARPRLAHELRGASEFVERVALFDVYQGALCPRHAQSAYNVRFSADDRTLSESDVASARSQLIARAESLGATLR